MTSSIRHFAQSCRPNGLWYFLLFPLGKIGEFSLLPSFCKPSFENNRLRGKISQAPLHDSYQLVPDYQLKGFHVCKMLIFSSLFESTFCNPFLNCLPGSPAIVLTRQISKIQKNLFSRDIQRPGKEAKGSRTHHGWRKQ